MKKRKVVFAAVAAVISGIVAFSCAGCVWFDFSSKRNKQSVSGSLGFEGNTGAWLASNVDSPRSEQWKMYEDFLESEGLSPDEFSFLDFLKELNDGSASLTTPMRASVAIIAQTEISETQSSMSYGSGVIYSVQQEEDATTAYILTNYHVVGSNKIADHFYTYLYGDTYGVAATAMQATYVGGSMDEDVALLKVEVDENRLDFVQSLAANIKVRDTDRVNVGEKVYAIGNPLGAGISAVSGTVGVAAEYTKFAKINGTGEIDMLVMRIDAPANHGNSGGGLFDAQGRFLGLVNGGKEVSMGNNSVPIPGFGYALPANRVLSVAQNILDMLEANRTQKAFCGLLGELTIASSRGVFDEATQSLGIVEDVMLTSVDTRSPFDQDVTNKVIEKIKIQDADGTEITSKVITRKYQVETLLYLIRKDFTVTITFEGGEEVAGTYSADTNFAQVN